MKQKLYLVIHGKTKSVGVSYVIAQVLYALVCIAYRFFKFFQKEKIIEKDIEFARKQVSKISPKPVSVPQMGYQEVDEKLDLSIIVPVYNYEHVLEEMINSILNQKTSYTFELIIVDDGSGPNAKRILEKYKKLQNVCVIHQQNQGISAARNTGIGASKGKRIMFVDCDDVLKQGIVQELLDIAFEENVDIAMCGHSLVKQENGMELSRREEIYSNWNLENYGSEDIRMNYPGLPWGKVYRRELFRDIRYPVNYWYEDTITQFLVFRKAKSFAYLPKALYDYRWYEGNYSKVQKQSNSRCVEHYWIVEHMLEENDRIGLPRDEVLYRLVLKHLGSYLYFAVCNLDERIIEDIFVLACDLACRVRPEKKCHLSYKLKELERCFACKDYTDWVLACKLL